MGKSKNSELKLSHVNLNLFMQNHDQEQSEDEVIEKQEQVKATDPICNKDEAETSINDLPGVDFEADEAESKPDEKGEKTEEDFVVEVNEAWDDKVTTIQSSMRLRYRGVKESFPNNMSHPTRKPLLMLWSLCNVSTRSACTVHSG